MALKIKNREEAIAVLRDMIQRKKEMEKKVQEEFAKARKEAENYYVTIKFNASQYVFSIQCIIEEFFLTNPNILLYQYETGYNRQAM